MDTLTRRKFLLASGVVGAGALVAGAGTVTLHELLQAADDDPLPTDSAVLVLVTLYGGNDGLNTVIPAADHAYQQARPELAYAEKDVLGLGDGLGLNPAMKGFKSLWDDRKLAIVRGVSYPKPDHSHFRSMDIWQTGSPSAPAATGWLGRWLDRYGRDPLKAVSIGATLPPLLAGAQVAGAAVPLGGGSVPAMLQPRLAGLAKANSADDPFTARAARSYADLLRVEDSLRAVSSASPTPDDDDDRPQDGASAGGQSALAAQLALVEQAVAAGAPPRVYSVSLGGFDTHSNEKATQERLLGELDGAVSGFLGRIDRVARGRSVVVAVYSEFGRRVAANANQGTDHGTAGPLFVAGAGVKGGFYGDQPSLSKLDNGDLAVTTDFRDVYATLLERVLGADPADILAGHKGRVALL